MANGNLKGAFPDAGVVDMDQGGNDPEANRGLNCRNHLREAYQRSVLDGSNVRFTVSYEGVAS